jgi:hypothetical protein
MKNPLDHLFREKLADHSLSPEPGAWARVRRHISKKNNGWKPWLRAASVIILLGAGFLIWKGVTSSNGVSSNKMVADKSPREEVSAQIPLGQEPNKPESITQRNKSKQQESAFKTTAPREKNKTQEISSPIEEKPQINTTLTDLIVATKEEIANEPTMVAEIAESNAEDQAIVVVYTLELPKALAEPKEKKTGLKRVLELAREARSTENPIGELRQAKNEILAFDFGKDKEQRNNK